CITPPIPHSCSFYSTCLEPHFHCGPTGYPLDYGDHYCNKFSSPSNLHKFTPKGQQWMWKTMLCLQTALIPELQVAVPSSESGRLEVCNELKDTAFDSHPRCYISSGVCELTIKDWVTILQVVGLKTLFANRDAVEQSLRTVRGCVDIY
ncbi:hypothetical protein L218DRAFT_822519, partial [Marasmius fiardii PR-910]